MKEALIILGDQLFPHSYYKAHKDKIIFMAEDLGLCTHYKYHKHKIALFLTSMRVFKDELEENGHSVHYEKFSEKSFLDRLKKFLNAKKINKVFVPEIQDKFFEQELLDFLKDSSVETKVLPSPMFLTSRDLFKEYLSRHKRPFMKTFYEGERKRLGILVDQKNNPVGGKWSFDTENRKKPPKELTHKELLSHTPSKHLKDVTKIIDEHFSDHPGEMDNFWAPSDRKSALKALGHFIKYNLKSFGDYQDAITNRAPFLYHSVISPAMNMGLLTPEEVINKVLEVYEKGSDIPLSSIEGFIRQVMGWREFVRGIYQNYSEEEEKRNFFKHERKLTKDWYQGTTGLPPVDDAIIKANTYGYCHHIERLMVLSNVMLLSEIHPHEVHRWFMEMFIDSADWVMGPNVYGMGQFSDGGIFATKPYVSGSNYILKMSDYKKGDWCDIWDGLFWRFIGNQKSFFSKNPRMNMMVKTLEKMDKKKKVRLFGVAEEFLKAKTK